MKGCQDGAAHIASSRVLCHISPVNAMEPPDSHHLSAAEGWLGLGNWREARAELNLISPELRGHPDVLVVARELYFQAQKWDSAAEVAAMVARLRSDEVDSWITWAYATRRMDGGGLTAAKQILVEARERFQNSAIVAYNLACYECQLGQPAAARQWLKTAFRIGNLKQIRGMALADRDLEPLWDEIREMTGAAR